MAIHKPRPLTARQQAVLDFIARCNAAGTSATVRAICDVIVAASPNAAAGHVKALINKGVVYRDDNGVLQIDHSAKELPCNHQP